MRTQEARRCPLPREEERRRRRADAPLQAR